MVIPEFKFDLGKNTTLKATRGISFEEVILLIQEGCLLGVVDHPNKEKYPDQKIYLIDVGGYVYMVPFVRTGQEVFLKTIIPSRKATRDYLGRKEEGK